MAAPPSDRAPSARWRRLSFYAAPLGIALLVVASAPFAVDAIRDAVTLAPAPDASLRRPAGYVLLAPMSNVLDVLTLLSLRQHVAVLVTLIVLFAVWWGVWGRAVPPAVRPARRRVRQAARIGVAALSLATLYAAALVMPRPMAALDVGSDLLVVDFHAHTKYSHDGRPDWSASDLRDWHRNAGFDAAYVTDHRTFEGSREGWPNNPRIVGQGTVLLPGIEVVWRGEHVNVLDADRIFQNLLTPTLRDIDEEALRLASTVGGNEPVLIETLPGDLGALRPAHGPHTAGVRAIELVDGAPKGLGQTRRERTRIVALADSLNLSLVAGSDHHGWGHAAAGWTLFAVPGWRSLPPERLSSTISTMIRKAGRRATTVLERYVPDTDSGVALPLTLPVVAWGMFRTLTVEERVMWLAWTLLLTVLVRATRARRTAPAPA